MHRLACLLALGLVACPAEPEGDGTIAMRGVVVDLFGSEIEGSACWVDAQRESCADTDGEGSFVLEGLPPGASGLLTVRQKYSDGETLFPGVLGVEDALPVFTWVHREYFDVYRREAGLEPVDGTGTIVVQVSSVFNAVGAEGASVRVDPSVGADGPYFKARRNTSNRLDLEATTTTDSGLAFLFNVEPGPRDLEVSWSEGPCTQTGFGGPLPTLDVEPDTIVTVAVVCQ